MKWLENAKKEPGYFTANYWVTGKAMHRDTASWQPDNSPTDSAFQLLKAGECASFYQESEYSDLANMIKNVGGPWIKYLKKLDRRTCYAWPHAQQAGTNVFPLDDHVWIWKALKIIEKHSLGSRAAEREKGTMRPRDVQQEMLRRFTTENETLRKRMLAVTRSSRETRFLLHARDTALFYDECDQCSLPQKTSFREMWVNTLEVQALHEFNNNTFWDNTLRYALAVMMATRIIDDITKEPGLFKGEEDRDYFFYASFEIPFILFIHADSIDEAYRSQSKSSDAKESPSTERQADDLNERPEGQKAQPKRQQALSEGTSRESRSMKKTVPFSRLFDSNSIVEIEEEWLYNYPTFLMNDEGKTDDDIHKILKTQDGQDTDADVNERVVIRGARKVLQLPDEGKEWVEDTNVWRSHVYDVKKTKKRGKDQRNHDNDLTTYPCYSNDDLKRKLTSSRDAKKAKKRFIWLLKADWETALICFLGSTDAEQPAISLFFDRHWYKEAYFFDDTTMVMNTWETELHLGFYHLVDTNEDFSSSIRTSSEDVFPGEKKRIEKTSMGFRFNGDLFDRYWTCHFIEDENHSKPKLPFPHQDKEQGWRQRKVLELYLFEHILNTLIKYTREIFEEVKRGLEVRQGQDAFSSAILSSEVYFYSSARWQRYQNILQLVGEALENVELEVSKWESREKDRGQERPRWTRNDERKYGGTIKKLQRSTSTQIGNLHGAHANIKSLKETLEKRYDQTREDLSLRKSEDIRFFTYVTVVFLPLGFASSIFSMSGTPAPDLIISLIICAVAALAITGFALFNAKTLAYLTQRVVRLVEIYSQSKMEQSVLILENEGVGGARQEGGGGFPNGGNLYANYYDESLGTVNASRFWFLALYVVLELPARRVAIAYKILKDGNPTWAKYIHVVLGVFSFHFASFYG
ncbi:hypothetical protein AAE478_000337 [Parahypoxylon ruwenzoriense]